MLRPAAVVLALMIASPALAQNAELDRLRLQALQDQNIRLQEQQLAQSRLEADLRQAQAEQSRMQADANLRLLESRNAAAVSSAASTAVIANEDAVRRLQDRELAASNARIKAIKPAP